MSKNETRNKNTEPDQRRDNGGSTAPNQKRGRSTPMETRRGVRQKSGSGIRRIATAAIANLEGQRAVAQQGVTEDSGDNPVNYSGFSSPSLPNPKGRKMISTVTKKRIISYLTWFNSGGLIVIAILLAILIGRVTKTQTANHTDTAQTQAQLVKAVADLKQDSAFNQNEMLCLLKVLPSQRTDSQQQACLAKAIKGVN